LPHDTPLIATIAVGLALAFALGLLAQRLKVPTIVGYLLAGVIIGPFTPGFVADQKIAFELAELGIMLLMFGVGLHFSIKDLLSVRAIAVPGAIGQIAVATLLGMGLATLLGWPWGAGLVFGLALSVASTVVLLRALQERGQVETEKGRIAVGWLIVEDLVMVLTLVLMPSIAGLLGGETAGNLPETNVLAKEWLGPVWGPLAATVTKVALFIALMLIVGRRVIPWVLHYAAHTGSRELFRLAVLAIALGIAFGSAKLFGVSFALGAFFAGVILAEHPLSSQAAKETLPLRDAFAVLFFVAVGMLFDPASLLVAPLAVFATIAIIVFGKSLAAYLIVRAFRYSRTTALTISASLAQIGEFSFILILLAITLGIVPKEAQNLIVAGAIFSIILNPVLFRLLDRHSARLVTAAGPAAVPQEPETGTAEDDETGEPTALTGHTILVGHGQVGARITPALIAAGAPFLVVEEREDIADALEDRGIEVFTGPAGEPALLDRLNLTAARLIVSTISDPYEAGHIVEAAKAANPAIRVIAAAHDSEGEAYLRGVGADEVLVAEAELARAMAQAVAAMHRAAPLPFPRA
jgi:CPA2 family monovalent cation:H+ antiporter-2